MFSFEIERKVYNSCLLVSDACSYRGCPILLFLMSVKTLNGEFSWNSEVIFGRFLKILHKNNIK
jgi:hypothetical protein